MNFFEDLVEELKQENLLEDTVTPSKHSSNGSAGEVSAEMQSESDEATIQEAAELAAASVEADLNSLDVSDDPREFYRKRAMEEVSSLQMVEHIFSGIEREYMKTAPQSYDDLEVKKALHKFLQVSGDLSSPSHIESEYKLMQETQSWITALSERDKKISVANLRRFCENSRPVLSSQAMMALCRFYRNSPGNENTRGKFEFVMTRLFSRETGDRKRALLFGHNEMIGHVKTLYANWASISLIDADDSKDEILGILAKFKEFAAEFEKADRFDKLIEGDFFNRYRLFKEELSDTFMLPEITAEAMDANVRLGNKYIDLIENERDLNGVESVEEKYGYTYDQVVSDAAGKTLLLVEVLRNADIDGLEYEQEEEIVKKAPPAPKPVQKQSWKERFFSFDLLGTNKWVVAIFVLAMAASFGIYFWADNMAGSTTATSSAAEVDLSNSDMREFIEKGRMTRETFYAIIKPAFNGMEEEQQKDFVKKVLEFSEERGLKHVNLINTQGRTVAFASGTRVEVFRP